MVWVVASKGLSLLVPLLARGLILSTPRVTFPTICELGNDRKIVPHREAKPPGELATLAPSF